MDRHCPGVFLPLATIVTSFLQISCVFAILRWLQCPAESSKARAELNVQANSSGTPKERLFDLGVTAIFKRLNLEDVSPLLCFVGAELEAGRNQRNLLIGGNPRQCGWNWVQSHR